MFKFRKSNDSLMEQRLEETLFNCLIWVAPQVLWCALSMSSHDIKSLSKVQTLYGGYFESTCRFLPIKSWQVNWKATQADGDNSLRGSFHWLRPRIAQHNSLQPAVPISCRRNCPTWFLSWRARKRLTFNQFSHICALLLSLAYCS